MPSAGGGTVVVVDDDDGLRAAMLRVLDAAGLEARGYANAEELLAERASQSATCLVVDLDLPGMSGLDLVDLLRHRGVTAPALRGCAPRPGATASSASSPSLSSATRWCRRSTRCSRDGHERRRCTAPERGTRRPGSTDLHQRATDGAPSADAPMRPTASRRGRGVGRQGMDIHAEGNDDMTFIRHLAAGLALAVGVLAASPGWAQASAAPTTWA